MGRLNSCCQFLGRVGPYLCERGVVMRHCGEFMNCHAFRHRRRNFVNQFAAQGANATAAEDLAGLRIGQEFYKTVKSFHDERFAVVVEWISRGEEGNSSCCRGSLSKTDGGSLRLGKYHVH